MLSGDFIVETRSKYVLLQVYVCFLFLNPECWNSNGVLLWWAVLL